MSVMTITIIVMLTLGSLSALILYLVAKKFYVEEDPRIDEIEKLLPGANCGGCGRKGCRDFAVMCVGSTSLEGVVCPGAGSTVMKQIASIVGLMPVETAPRMALLHCAGICSIRPRMNIYDGVRSCAMENSIYSGETACAYGCLGCGDCIEACPYGALTMDEIDNLPKVDFVKCVGCGKCVSVCPRGLFSLIPKDGKRIYIACMNRDKGSIAMKACDVSCIGCGKCRKVCSSDAIILENFLARIDIDKCVSCGKCMQQCPRKSILATNYV